MSAQRYSILIVDDNWEDASYIAERILEIDNKPDIYVPTIILGALEALDNLAKLAYSAVIVRLKLKGDIDGIKFCQMAYERLGKKSPPLIIATNINPTELNILQRHFEQLGHTNVFVCAKANVHDVVQSILLDKSLES